MHQTLDQTDSELGFARIEARIILVIRSEFIVNLARRGRTAVQNANSTGRPTGIPSVRPGSSAVKKVLWQGRTPVLDMPRWGLSVSGSELIGRASESERDERETDTESGRERLQEGPRETEVCGRPGCTRRCSASSGHQTRPGQAACCSCAQTKQLSEIAPAGRVCTPASSGKHLTRSR
jgi:hypothetical protein